MNKIIFRRFVVETLFAVTSLSVSLLIFFPEVNAFLLSRLMGYDKLVPFVVISVLPSFIIGLITYSEGETDRRLFLGVGLSMVLSLLILLLLNAVKPLTERDFLVILLALGFFASAKLCLAAYVKYHKRIPGVVQRILVVGNGPLAHQIGRLISESEDRFEFMGYVNCAAGGAERRCDLEAKDSETVSAEDIKALALKKRAQKIVVSLSERRGVLPLQEMLNCKLSGIEVLDAPTFFEQATGKLLIENITPSWFIFSHGFRVTGTYRFFKRWLDIGCALFGLLVSLPFLPLVVLIIKLDSPGPVLFRQVRVGLGDRNFVLYKFRTMGRDAEKGTGATWSQKNDPRITRVGRFLRKSRIDEIPQLFNVLMGDMSLVGPRPERPEFVAQLKQRIPYYSERHFVKPGVTGWAQVRYPYGASVEDAIEKLRYDLYYIKNISILFDLRIIFQTIDVVLRRKGGR